MSKHVQRYRLAAGPAAAYVGPAGECVVTTGDWDIRVHDGVTPGGYQLLKKATADATYANAATIAATIAALAASISTVGYSGAYADLTGKPAISTVGLSGVYADLTGKPALFDGTWASLTGKPAFAAVATSGAYADLTGKPAISTVGLSGAYADLTGKPTLGNIAAIAYTIQSGGAPGGGANGDLYFIY